MKTEIKTLANCDNVEFLSQTYKIADAVSAYVSELKIQEIRKKIPDVSNMDNDAKKKALNEAAKKNILEILRNALVENTEDTLKILGLICFCEDIEAVKNDRKLISEAMAALCDESVLDFFISVLQSLVKISKIL